MLASSYLCTMRMYFSIILLCCIEVFAQRKVHLWAGTETKAKSVTLTPYLAPVSPHSSSISPHPAIIVCPGGSYCWLDMKTEGSGVARWLQAHGFSAFVLKYRVQGIMPYITHSRLIFKGHQYPDAINDLQRAIQHVREHAEEYGVDPNRIGVMGFSAGGHLAVMSGTHNSQFTIHNCTPDFVAAIYPVVSMSHPCSHKRSRRALLGERGKRDRKMRDSLSLEKHVTKDCPSVFLVNCKDDHIVKYHNSELLDSALTAQGVNHRYIQYRTGGHGFGASERKGTTECRAWKEEFLNWIKSLAI